MSTRTLIATTIRLAPLIFLVTSSLLIENTKGNFFDLQPAESLPAIQINNDGSINPPTDFITQNENTYYLNDDLIQKYVLEVYCSDIVLDGQNHTVDGENYVGTGIFLSEVSNVTVKNTQLSHFTFAGVQLNSSSNCTLTGITEADIYTDGIILVNSHSNTIVGNQINTNSVGLELEISSENELCANNITNYGFNSISSYPGIALMNSPKNDIHDNNVVGKSTAVGMITGFHLVKTTSGNVIYHNNFINYSNPIYFQDNPFANSWDNGLEGNFWSSYNGTDADHNGISDAPYVLNSNNTDNHPLMTPINTSQAQLAQSSASSHQFSADLVYAYVEGDSYGVAVFNVTRVSDLPLTFEGMIEVFEAELFADGQLVSYKAVGWQIGKSLSMESMMSLTMSLHSFSTIAEYGLQTVEIPFKSLNHNLQEPVGLMEPIFLSIKRLGWIAVDGDSAQSHLNENETLQQVQLEKFESGFLYNRLVPVDRLSQINLLNPVYPQPTPAPTPTPTTPPTIIPSSPTPLPSATLAPSPSVPDFSEWAVPIVLFASSLAVVWYFKRRRRF